jgi:hypothetical protein
MLARALNGILACSNIEFYIIRIRSGILSRFAELREEVFTFI